MSASPTRVLVVEDEPIVAADIKLRLNALGFTVVGTAASGPKALTLVDETHPNLVLMDIRLKGPMDGVQTAWEIQRDWAIPVVFLTAYSEDATLERAKQAKPYGYLIKPFENRELKTMVEIAVSKHAVDLEIQRLSRLYAAQSRINRSVSHSRSDGQLLPEVCAALVEDGRFAAAWIGQQQAGESKWLTRASAGTYSGCLADIAEAVTGVSVGNAGRATATIIRGAPRPAAEAMPFDKLEFGSSLAVSITFRGQDWGRLVVFDQAIDRFSPQDTDLLAAVADDIGFALEIYDNDAKRNRAELELLKSEAHIRTLVNASPDGIIETDATGVIQFASEQLYALLGLSDTSQLLGKNIVDCVGPADRSVALANFQRALEGQRISGLYAVRSEQGRMFWAETRTCRLESQVAGTPSGVITLVRDVTERLEAESKLSSARFEVVARLYKAIESRGSAGSGHFKRLGVYGRLIAEKLGLAKDVSEMMQWAFALHDIGMLAIPEGITRQSRTLTLEELEVIKRHPAIGEAILQGSDHELLIMCAEVAGGHHERWDGTGYPRGLSGIAIPLAARVCAVCDAFDSMMTEHSYRAAMTFDAAVAEIKRCSGTQFDPNVVTAFTDQLDGFRAVSTGRYV